MSRSTASRHADLVQALSGVIADAVHGVFVLEPEHLSGLGAEAAMLLDDFPGWSVFVFGVPITDQGLSEPAVSTSSARRPIRPAYGRRPAQELYRRRRRRGGREVRVRLLREKPAPSRETGELPRKRCGAGGTLGSDARGDQAGGDTKEITATPRAFLAGITFCVSALVITAMPFVRSAWYIDR